MTTLPTNPEIRTAVVNAVLARIPGAKTADEHTRDNLPVGTYDIDLTITVKGTVNVAADGKTRQVNKFKPWQLAQLLANKLPTSIVDQCLDEAIKAALAGTDIEGADELAARTEASLEQASPFCEITRKGAVKVLAAVDCYPTGSREAVLA
jgi:hypothetical protein